MLSASSIPFHNVRYSGQIIADPAHAASTWVYSLYFFAILIIDFTSSNAPIDVPPIQIIIPAGFRLLAISLKIACSSKSARISKLSLVSILIRFFCPIPEILTALSIEECV